MIEGRRDMERKALVVDNDISRVNAICEALRFRFRSPTVWMAQDAREAVRILSRMKEMQWDLIFLEHDLGTGEWLDAGNGTTVALAMREIGVRAKKVIIQSVNRSGTEAIERILAPQYQVIQVPFPETLDYILDITASPSRSSPVGQSTRPGGESGIDLVRPVLSSHPVSG